MIKFLSVLPVSFFLFLTIALGIAEYNVGLEWKNEIYGYWSLADKSSTLEAKSEYIDQFVEKLEQADLSDHGAAIWESIDNDTELNLQALRTLQSRLEQIKTMDPASFEYQQAIQQITSQEQGEAGEMIGVLKAAWYIENHPIIYWDDIFWIIFITMDFLCGVFFFVVLTD